MKRRSRRKEWYTQINTSYCHRAPSQCLFWFMLSFVDLYSTFFLVFALKGIVLFLPLKIHLPWAKLFPVFCLVPIFLLWQSLSRPVLFLTFLPALPLCARSNFSPLLPQDLKHHRRALSAASLGSASICLFAPQQAGLGAPYSPETPPFPSSANRIVSPVIRFAD